MGNNIDDIETKSNKDVRVDGYYWVRMPEDERWTVADWCGGFGIAEGGWMVVGYVGQFLDYELHEIDENRITRNKAS